MQVTVFIDRGNGLCKTITSLGAYTTNYKTPEPVKQPSIIRQVEGGCIQIGKNRYNFGDVAIRNPQGLKISTREQRDKIAHLEIVVADAIHGAAPGGVEEPIDLSVVCSSPFASMRGTSPLVNSIKKQLKLLANGFKVSDSSYGPVSLDRVGVLPEGLMLLDCNPGYNGVIDLGLGTLLSGYRHQLTGEVMNLPLTGGDVGGCNTWLSAVLSDEQFLKEVASAGFTAPPSQEKLCELLGKSRWAVRNVDFRKYLRNHLSPVYLRVLSAAQTLASELQYSLPEEEVTPRVAMLGGGAALFNEILTDKQRAELAKFGLEIFDHLPDFQSVLMLEQIFRKTPEMFDSCKSLESRTKTQEV